MCRSFIIGVKYGLFSDEYMEVMRSVYLTAEQMNYVLVTDNINNKSVHVHINNINEILKDMEIDEELFNIEVLKD